MAYNYKQFKSLIERSLKELDEELCTPAAVNLLLGTAAQESRFGTYLVQMRGPAIGAFQMEPATFRWVQQKYGDTYKTVKFRVPEAMEWDLRLAIIMCRLRYRPIAKELPDATNIQGLAKYWKEFYNTASGKGTVEEFIANYNMYLK